MDVREHDRPKRGWVVLQLTPSASQEDRNGKVAFLCVNNKLGSERKQPLETESSISLAASLLVVYE